MAAENEMIGKTLKVAAKIIRIARTNNVCSSAVLSTEALAKEEASSEIEPLAAKAEAEKTIEAEALI
jgi:hypothetical protein